MLFKRIKFSLLNSWASWQISSNTITISMYIFYLGTMALVTFQTPMAQMEATILLFLFSIYLYKRMNILKS